MNYTVESLSKLRPIEPGACLVHHGTCIAWDQAMFSLRLTLGDGDSMEIGCRYGNSTVPMVAAMANIYEQGKHYAMDPFIERAHLGTYVAGSSASDEDYYFPRFEKTVADYAPELLEMIMPVIGYSQEVLPKVKEMVKPQSLAMIFIDGDHSESGVYQDVVNYHDFVKVGGVIAFDDWGGFGVTKGYERAKPQLKGSWTNPVQFAHSRVYIKRLS